MEASATEDSRERPAVEGGVRTSRRFQQALFGIVGVALLVALYTQRASLLAAAALFLSVEDSLVPSDVIFLFSGGFESRPFYAASLYKQGYARAIVVARERELRATRLDVYPNPTDVSIEILKKLGVPESDIALIVVQGGVGSTWDEGMVFAKFAREHDLRSAILVTSPYHTRRTRWALRRTFGDQPVVLRFSSAPDPQFNESNWWTTEEGVIAYVNEYIKLLYYVVRGQPPPPVDASEQNDVP